MDRETFKHWYKDNKNYISRLFFEDYLISFLSFCLVFVPIILIQYYNDQPWYWVLILGVILIIILLLVFLSKRVYYLNKKESVSLLLYDIAEQIDIYKSVENKKKVIDKIKLLKRLFYIKNVSEFSLLKSLYLDIRNLSKDIKKIPNRINYSLMKSSEVEALVYKIRKLAYYIYIDDIGEIRETLELIKSEHPNVLDFKNKTSFNFSSFLKKCNNRWILLFFWTVVLLVITYFVNKYTDINTDVLAYCFSGLVGIVIMVLFGRKN